jgi:hypothetical protein
LYSYTIKQIFIHIDDPNPVIQTAIVKVLEKASRVQTNDFLEIARDCENKFSHTVLIKNLIDFTVNNANNPQK